MKNFSRNKKLKMHIITLNSEFSTLNSQLSGLFFFAQRVPSLRLQFEFLIVSGD